MSKQFQAEKHRRDRARNDSRYYAAKRNGRFSFFSTPAVNAAATDMHTNTKIADPVEKELERHYRWPKDYPEKYKDDDHAVRIRYRLSNKQQCQDTLSEVVTMYTEDVCEHWRTLNGGTTHPHLEAYIQSDPTGEEKWKLTDPLIYKNAHKMAAAASASVATTPGTGGGETDTAESGTSTPPPSATTSDSATPLDSSTGDKEESPAPAPAPPHTPTVLPPAMATVTVAPDGTYAVETEFAGVLHKMHDEIYKLFRANIKRFIDKQGKSLLKEQIAKWERAQGVKGNDRLKKGKRYPWRDMGAWVVMNLSIPTLPSFYFLPLFIVIRKKGSTVTEWCQVVKTILWNIQEFDRSWAKVGAKEAIAKLYAFLSPKERDILNLHVKVNHKSLMGAGTIHTWLDNATDLEKIIDVIGEISPTEFPSGYDPEKHSKDAIKRAYVNYAEFEELLNENKALKDRVQKLTDANKRMGKERLKKIKAQQKTNSKEASPAPSKPTKTIPGLKMVDDVTFKKCYEPSQSGKRPCKTCAKYGLRIFHKPPCDPERLREALANKKNRKPKAPRTYKPEDYPPNACTLCIKDGVSPKLASNHREFRCMRRPGGECEQNGCKTKEDRNQYVRQKLKEFGENKRLKEQKENKKERKRKKRPSKTTQVADRNNDSSSSPSESESPTDSSAESSSESEETRPAPGLSKKRYGSGKHKKLRSRKYTMCQYAAIHPMTEAELEFAMTGCPEELRTSASYKDSVRYGFCVDKDGNRNGEKLIALRARMQDEQKRNKARKSNRSPHGKPKLEKSYASKPKKAKKAKKAKKRKRKHKKAKRKRTKKPRLSDSEQTWAEADADLETPDSQIGHSPVQSPAGSESPQYNPTSYEEESDSDEATKGFGHSSNESSDDNEKVQPNSCTNPPNINITSNAEPQGVSHKAEDHVAQGGTDILGIPSGEWCPTAFKRDLSIRQTLINIKHGNTKTRSKSRKRKRTRSSEKKGSRLLQCYVKYRDANGAIRKGRIKLDTQSNGNYSLPGISLPRPWRSWEPRTVTGISDTVMPLGRPQTFTIMKGETPVSIDTNAPTPGMFKDGTVALLGVDAIHNLGIDLLYAIKHMKHRTVRYIPEQNHLLTKAKGQAIKQFTEGDHLHKLLHKTTNLSERVLRQYLDKNPDDYTKKPLDESIDIAPDFPKEVRDLIIALVKRYDTVFAGHTNVLPPAMKGVKPHMFKLKEGAQPVYETRPTFSPSKAKIINEWLDWALKQGLVEEATTTSYASRLILAAKRKSGTPKSALPDGIRVAWAGTRINDTIQKTVPTYTDAWKQLYKVANYKYKFSADGLKQYWSIPLAEEAKEITAFWTPRGLFQFTRLVMGTKNAATVAQNAYTKATHTKLPERSFDNIANFADDFLGGADTPMSMVRVFEDFLIMCKKAGITLNPSKIRIGYTKEQFYGLTVEEGKISPAMRNVDPVKNMVNPKTRAELRSIMGIFNQFSSFIKDYGRTGHATILNEMVSPKVPWLFTEKHEHALNQLKKIVQEGLHLYAPNNDYPLVLDTDGSDDGWGAVLYQVINGQKRIIKMWSKTWKTEAWQKKPPYHREAKAWMNGMTAALPYTVCNPFPVQCWTDHSPLQWIKHTSGKGPVSQFIVDTLSQVDYEMHYIKGEDNYVADGLSRFPMLGPQTVRRAGLENMIHVLLSAILKSKVDTTRIWFDARKDTKFLVSHIYDWNHARKGMANAKYNSIKTCYQDSLSQSRLKKLKYTMGIWAPPADKITRQVREAFRQKRPFACLIPSDLVNRIAFNIRGEHLPNIDKHVQATRKITFLSAGLTWLIHGIRVEDNCKQVYANSRVTDPTIDRVTPEYELNELMKHLQDSNLTPPLPQCNTRAQWIQAQKDHRCKDLWPNDKRVHTVQDDLLVFEENEGEAYRTIVPEALQEDLIKWKHHQMCHMAPKKVFNELKKRFHFNHMFKRCHEVIKRCALCNLLKARMRLAHKHFRAKLLCTPRTSYGADYYGVKQNAEGYNNILGIIDLATGNLILKAVKGRTAANTAHTLFYEVVMRKGIPLRFHSDAAKEFLSTAMSSLQSLLGIRKSDTLAHNPKSNAKIERVWEFVGRALRAMPPDQYKVFHLYMPILAHVWNCTPDSNTNITPFEAEHGMKCRSVAESLVDNPPAQGLPAAANDLRTIAIAARAFNETLSNIKHVERARAANKLNSYGQPIQEFHVGDRVAFYLPPNAKEAKRMGKNPKHMLQYKGPGKIVKALSPNGTAFEIKCGAYTYRRNIMHLSKFTADGEAPANVQLQVDYTVSVGSHVAVLDDDEDAHYHIGRVTDINENVTTIHYFATKGKKLRSAVWTPLYHHPHSNQIVRRQPDTITRNFMRYTGVVDTRDREDSLIILPNVGLTSSMRVNTRTSRILRKMTKYRHHIMGRTWDPQT